MPWAQSCVAGAQVKRCKPLVFSKDFENVKSCSLLKIETLECCFFSKQIKFDHLEYVCVHTCTCDNCNTACDVVNQEMPSSSALASESQSNDHDE